MNNSHKIEFFAEKENISLDKGKEEIQDNYFLWENQIGEN